MDKDRYAERGDSVAQATHTRYLRIIQLRHFEAATGEELAANVRAWFVAREMDGVELSEEREFVDWRYQVDGGVHHMMIYYAE